MRTKSLSTQNVIENFVDKISCSSVKTSNPYKNKQIILTSKDAKLTHYDMVIAQWENNVLYVMDFESNLGISASVTTKKYISNLWRYARNQEIGFVYIIPCPDSDFYSAGDYIPMRFNTYAFPVTGEDYSHLVYKTPNEVHYWKTERGVLKAAVIIEQTYKNRKNYKDINIKQTFANGSYFVELLFERKT